MNSAIYNGHVEHARLAPVQHRFRVPVTFFAFDPTELSDLDQRIRGFGHNRSAPVSLRDRDYLAEGDAPLADKLKPWIDTLQLPEPPARVTLVTSPRWLGAVFNPVSFYLLDDADGRPLGMIAEVNNTFGDRHVYAVPLQKADGRYGADHPKEFHVSPFNNLDGAYRFTLRREGDELYIGVDLYRDGQKILLAWIEGTRVPLTTRSLWHNCGRHPLRPWLTLPRIVWQALLLRFRKKLRPFKRPEPDHPHTLRSRHHPRPNTGPSA